MVTSGRTEFAGAAAGCVGSASASVAASVAASAAESAASVASAAGCGAGVPSAEAGACVVGLVWASEDESPSLPQAAAKIASAANAATSRVSFFEFCFIFALTLPDKYRLFAAALTVIKTLAKTLAQPQKT